MNIFQNFNNGGSALIFAAVLAGLYKLFDKDITSEALIAQADSLFLLFFIVFFRIKMHLDDNKYFKTFDAGVSKRMYFGFLLAVAIWFLFAAAAGVVKYPETSAAILAIAFAISTVWIVIHLRELAKSNAEAAEANKPIVRLRYNWVIVNMLYIILLILYNQQADILVTVHGHKADLSKWGFIVLMIGVMALDHVFSSPQSET